MRARVILWSTRGLASMKHFAILSSNTYEYSRGLYFHLGIRFFSGISSSTRTNIGLYEANKLYFYPSAEGSKTKDKKTKQKKRQPTWAKARTLHLAAELTVEQRHIFDVVTDAALNNKGGLFMIDAPAGTGKSFTQCAIAAHIRAQRMLVLCTASSGIAALILPGGLTAHSTFLYATFR